MSTGIFGNTHVHAQTKEKEYRNYTYNCTIVHVGIGLLTGENFPKDNSKRENINL
jgi:hypothetical protein